MFKSLIYNDTEVVPLFNDGNEAAFRYLYDKFQAALFFRAYKILDSRQEAEDVTAESFVKLWHARSSFNSLAAIGSWLKITTRNAALDILKHRRIVAESKNQLMANAMTEEEEWTNSDLFAEALREIHRQIELLPPKSRQIFKLRYIEGLRNEEIAQQLHIHNQSVRDHLSRALKFLRIAVLEKKNLFSFLLLLLNTK